MRSPRRFSIALPVAFLVGLTFLSAPQVQAAERSTAAVPLERLVRPDGTLDLNSGFRGSVSAAGWRMVPGADGAPRFVRGAGDAKAGAITGALTPAAITSVPEDVNWDDRFGAPFGVNDHVYALASDGNGILYVGGAFNRVGGATASYIAAWDGTSWSALGSGVNGILYALTVDGSGDLYAGGSFTQAGGVSASAIAKWDGTNWSPLGSGMGGTFPMVSALVFDGNGNLYAGGSFSAAGGVAANYIAMWDGSSWSSLGSGMLNNTVNALTVDGSGNLYAGGSFTSAGGVTTNHIARWNGTSWSPLGLGTNGPVSALAVDSNGSDLCAGGEFSLAGGVTAYNIARWNGTSWSALGSGISGVVHAIAVDGSHIYAGGDFHTAGGTIVNHIADWNGSNWLSLGSGTNERVDALAVDGNAVGTLWVGGRFTMAGGEGTAYLAEWNGASWPPLRLGLGMNYRVEALAADGTGNLYAGGSFTNAGGVGANYVAKWDGTSWSAPGSGIQADGTYHVAALAVGGSGNLFAGGDFGIAGQVLANNIAMWDGTSWSALGSGMNASVYALAVDGSGNLYTGGAFGVAGGVSAAFIAKWDGTRWARLGTGMNSSVYALAVDGSGTVYAGGWFTRAGGVTASQIAKWNGTSWSPLGTGVNNPVYALAVDESGNLYAGGDFTIAGGVAASRVAKWNGTNWSALGSGVNDRVYALAVGGGNVYAGGNFTTAGGAAANRIARWDGTNWSAVGSGTNNPVLALEMDGSDNLYTGGNFTTAGDKPASYVGMWHAPLLITATAGANGSISPSGAVTVPRSGSQTFTITPNAGYVVADVLVDGASVGKVTSYTFDDVQAGHTIAASFMTFTEIAAGLPGVSYGSVAWGDYDNDGDLDILLTGSTYASGKIARVYRNNGGGMFEDINAGLTGVSSSSAAWGDYDGDGDLDIVLAGDPGTGAITRIYRNDHGVFFDLNAGLTGLSCGTASWGDYDNDGDLDILLAGGQSTNRVAAIYRNDSGAFTNTGAALQPVSFGAAAWGDYDNDGDLDILLMGDTSSGHIARVYRNDGNGTFNDIVAGLTGVYVGAVAWGDYDSDGDLDILLTGAAPGGVAFACVYRNDSGVFTDIIAGLPGVYFSSVAWGDYDNDGDSDILLTGYTGGSSKVARVYSNDGGVFRNINAGLPPAGMGNSAVAWGDCDNDGDLDMLVTGSEGQYAAAYNSRIFRTDDGPTNSAPAMPGGLSASVAEGIVTLNWSAASDAESEAPGLSYNLRVGTTQGGSQIRSPMAAGTGYRRVVAFGNAGQVTSQALALQEGQTYYWSVQTVDTGLQGSAFAPEATFTFYDAPTPPGANVQVLVGPVDLTFDGVTVGGTTGVDVQSGGPELPAGLMTVPVVPPTYYHISTTSTWTGALQVCIEYDPAQVQGDEADLQLMHYVGDAWEEVAAVVDVDQNLICGAVASLSPFAVTQQLDASGVAETPPPHRTCLYQNTPNPFSPGTTIQFDLVRAEPVRLAIYDISGRVVRVLVNEASVAAGRHAVPWDGRDAIGARVASGMYMYRLETPTVVQSRRLLMLK